jgi:ABC-2 type transport system ATP-binding protein
MSKEFIIQTKDVSKAFKSFKKESGLLGSIKSLIKRDYTEFMAVKNVNLNIRQGEIIGYIGANGAGKSTTIKMLTGILTPTNGEVIVDGRIPYKDRTQNAKNIGVVFGQKTQLWWDLPVGETFTILKEIYQIPDEFYKEQLEYFNQVFELNEFMDKTVRTLSLGQRMRADLAASMLHNPKVLYLDEPTIGLDVVVKERIRKAIKDMNKKYNTTIILTTHDMNDIEELCNRIIIIDNGSILYDGDIDSIRKKYGFERRITFDIRYDNEIEMKLSLSSLHSNILGSDDTNLKYEFKDNQLTIIFNRNVLDVSSIMNHILSNFKVLDFTVQDMDIESIVKGIYNTSKIIK